jgi:hypothetical protein
MILYGTLASVQVWRLVTHVGVVGGLGLPLLFDVIWILTYGSTLESSVYSLHPEDYLFMYIFGAGTLAVISLLTGPLLKLAYITFTGRAMVAMLIYVWSREFPRQARCYCLLQLLETPTFLTYCCTSCPGYQHSWCGYGNVTKPS